MGSTADNPPMAAWRQQALIDAPLEVVWSLSATRAGSRSGRRTSSRSPAWRRSPPGAVPAEEPNARQRGGDHVRDRGPRGSARDPAAPPEQRLLHALAPHRGSRGHVRRCGDRDGPRLRPLPGRGHGHRQAVLPPPAGGRARLAARGGDPERPRLPQVEPRRGRARPRRARPPRGAPGRTRPATRRGWPPRRWPTPRARCPRSARRWSPGSASASSPW